MPVGDNQAVARTMPSLQGEQQAAPQDFTSFFRSTYRQVVQAVMYAGATEQEADEAVAAAMEDVLRRWDQISSPRAYARKAAVSHFIREKKRGNDRTRRQLAEYAEARQDGVEDAGLTVWEDRQWVAQILGALPPAQREVMTFITDGFTPSEVAELLGKTSEAVRQNLCAARARLTVALLDQDDNALRPAPTPRWPGKEAR